MKLRKDEEVLQNIKTRLSNGSFLFSVVLIAMIVATTKSPMLVGAEEGYLWAYQSSSTYGSLYKLDLNGNVLTTLIPSALGPIGGLAFQPAPSPPQLPPSPPVGGALISMGIEELLTPWIGLSIAVMALTVFIIKRRRA
ncbi:MAG: hypothetical protein QW638_07745 [Candidatus Bathyarchaeia archaeon]|nr:hypothetical protein [Candidatus Bathyarchaeota archaeon]